jgi:anhydro-N-acetylmuramic acid kinase
MVARVNPMERLTRTSRRPSRIALGLMSGMSRDGIDVAVVRIEDGEVRPHVTPLAVRTFPYAGALVARLRQAEDAVPAVLCDLERDLTEVWIEAIGETLAGLPAGDAPYVVGSHGQTVFHRPRSADVPAATLQIGDADLIAERTGFAVVSDFRRRDIAAGGEGAPLIAIADWLLHGEPGTTVACNNLGSISNVTVLPPALDDLLAFDTGPANALVDAFARTDPDSGGIDRDGTLSARGAVDDDLLLWLYMRRASWLARPPPKSAGYGTFGQALADEALAAHPALAPADRVRTAVEFTAQTLADAYENHALTRFPGLSTVRFSGGGCCNPTLMQAIGAKLGRLGLEVELLPEPWVAGKEAIGFALLADRTVRGLPGNHPGATGARAPVVLGRISP